MKHSYKTRYQSSWGLKQRLEQSIISIESASVMISRLNVRRSWLAPVKDHIYDKGRKLKVINPSVGSTKPTEPRRQVSWKFCVLPRAEISERLVFPENSNGKDAGAGYKTSALDIFSDFQELNENLN